MATIPRRSVSENSSSALLSSSFARRMMYSAYDVNCDGTRMLAGPHLIDGTTGELLQILDDPNQESTGAFKSEINTINCVGDVIVLSSFRGLHVYQNNEFVRTLDIQTVANSTSFYPFGKIALNCAGDRLLVTTPVDSSRRNHSVLLLDPNDGSVLHRFPHYYEPVASAEATSSQYGLSIAMNCKGDRILVGYPASHNERGKIDLYNDQGVLLQRIDCQGCPSGAHFGISVDLSDKGDIMLVTVRSQDIKNESDGELRRRRLQHMKVLQQRQPSSQQQKTKEDRRNTRRRRRQLVPWRPNRNSGIRAVAYLFNDRAELLQIFKYDEREMDDYDAEWRGRINQDATRIMVSSSFGSQQIRTILYNRTGHTLYKSKTDMIVELNANSTLGIGHGAQPDGVYVYELPPRTRSSTPTTNTVGSSTAGSSNSSSSGGSGMGGLIAAIVLMLLVAITMIFWVRAAARRRRKKAVATRVSEQEEVEGAALELPPVS